MRAAGLPLVAWRGFVRAEWERDRDRVIADIGALGLPVFVKPANLGSSVGISKVKTQAELVPAIELALEFDRKVVVEAGVVNAREIECAVLGNDDPETSVPGEIIPSREFYDYEAKYLDEGSQSVIPAELSAAQVAEVRRLAVAAFRVDRRGRPVARRLPAVARHRRDLRQRDQHHAGLHHHQHVRQDVGSQRRELPGARRSADSTRAGTSFGETAAAYQRGMKLMCLRCLAVPGVPMGWCLVPGAQRCEPQRGITAATVVAKAYDPFSMPTSIA